jgi:hypothetical protein
MEKTHKIDKVGGWAKYSEWWLVLVDHISFGLDKFERELFREQVALTHKFNKLVLLHHLDPTRAFEA